jgi:hypothetical protein
MSKISYMSCRDWGFFRKGVLFVQRSDLPSIIVLGEEMGFWGCDGSSVQRSCAMFNRYAVFLFILCWCELVGESVEIYSLGNMLIYG